MTTKTVTCKCGKYIINHTAVRDLATGQDHFTDVCCPSSESIAKNERLFQSNTYFDTNGTLAPVEPKLPDPVMVKPRAQPADYVALEKKLAETERILFDTQERCRKLTEFDVKVRNGQVEKSRRLTLKPLPGCTTEVRGIPGCGGTLVGREYTLDFGKEMEHLILLSIPYRPDGEQSKREEAAMLTMQDLRKAYPGKKIVLIRTLPGFEITVCEITR